MIHYGDTKPVYTRDLAGLPHTAGSGSCAPWFVIDLEGRPPFPEQHLHMDGDDELVWIPVDLPPTTLPRLGVLPTRTGYLTETPRMLTHGYPTGWRNDTDRLPERLAFANDGDAVLFGSLNYRLPTNGRLRSTCPTDID